MNPSPPFPLKEPLRPPTTSPTFCGASPKDKSPTFKEEVTP